MIHSLGCDRAPSRTSTLLRWGVRPQVRKHRLEESLFDELCRVRGGSHVQAQQAVSKANGPEP